LAGLTPSLRTVETEQKVVTIVAISFDEQDRIAGWIHELDANTPAVVQGNAVRSLAALGPSVFPWLLEVREKTRWDNVVRVIREIGYPESAPAIDWLVHQLQDVNWPGTMEGMEILIEIGAPVVPYLRRVMQDFAADGWWMAGICRMLERMDRIVIRPLVPELLRLLELGTDENELDWEAIGPLAQIGSPEADAAIPLLCSRIVDQTRHPELRRLAAAALGEFRAPAIIPAILCLRQALKDPAEEVRIAASASIAKIEGATF
jgi:HEAT repeat protein